MESIRTRTDMQLLRCSGWYRSQPVGGPPGQGDYLNCVIAVRTSLKPHDLLQVCHEIEADFGRQRGERWAARTLDIDLLLYGSAIIDTSDLIVPHPRMAERSFVLTPAAEIAADWRHPQLKKTIAELKRQLDQDTPNDVE